LGNSQVSIYIFGFRIYLDSDPTVANASDIGLYDDADNGSNQVFRLIEADISSYSPTYTWKTGILKPKPFGDFQENVDFSYGGNLTSVGGTNINATNTLIYNNSFTQLDKILDDNNLRLNGLRGDVVRFEVSGGSLTAADGDIVFRGICGEPSWNETVFSIPLETSLLKRRSNLATVINNEDYPDASPDIIGKIVPVTFGEFKPEYDVNDNVLWNGYTKFVRVANKESIYENYAKRTLNEDEKITLELLASPERVVGLKIFPVVGGGVAFAAGAAVLMYKIQLTQWGVIWEKDGVQITTGVHSLTYFENKYVFVIEGIGQGKYRKITSAQVDLDSSPFIIELTIADYFEETLHGNATATATDQSWIETIDIARQYQSDVWQCHNYLDENGKKITTGINFYSYDSPQKAKVTTENTDAIIEEKPTGFYRLPSYAYEISGNINNKVTINVSLFNNNPDSMNSFLIFPAKEPELITTTDELVDFGDSTAWFKHADGIFKFPEVTNLTSFLSDYFISRLIDKKHNTLSRLRTLGPAASIRILLALKFKLPDYPKGFEHDGVYVGIRNRVTGLGINFDVDIKWLRFMGDATSIVNIGKRTNVIVEDILDSYYSSSYDSNNLRFYFELDNATQLTGYTNFEISNIDTIEQYNSLEKIGLFITNTLGFTQPHNYNIDLYQLAIMFRKEVSIKDAIYSPFRGRIYGAKWGTSEGTSSSSSSSSSQSSPSSSLSSSSSSDSSSSTSNSSSSSSQSSPSSSSSSSASCDMGVGRKNACDMINNPIDILEHTLRLQDWSEQGGVKNWGKEYANNPLVDVSTSEGGFDYEDLNPLKNLQPARQITNRNNAYTDSISKSLCKGYFLCNYQNPTTGKESIAYIAEKSLSAPATTITLSDILPGTLGEVSYPKMKGIFCEPVIKYAKNPATGEYDKTIQVTNSDAATFDSSYVIGLSGTTAELMWQRAHILRQAYRQVEPAPSDMTDHDWIVTENDAVWYLDTWYSWMGALNTDGTTSGIEFEPKKRISFSVSYETGKDWHLAKHIKLQLPHQTDDSAIECIIEKLTKNINKGSEKVTAQVVLYGAADEIALYIQDTWTQGTLLADWQDDMDTQAGDLTNANDVQDIT